MTPKFSSLLFYAKKSSFFKFVSLKIKFLMPTNVSVRENNDSFEIKKNMRILAICATQIDIDFSTCVIKGGKEFEIDLSISKEFADFS